MKAIVKMVNGDECTITGDIVNDIHGYFTKQDGISSTLPLGWVCCPDSAINFNHVVSVKFEKEAE